MITREELRQLAECRASHSNAISFYFQPQRPQNQSHREESILVKDLVRDALRQGERNGGNGHVRADLDRILALAEGLHGNHARAKAVFACAASNIWKEFDLPARLRKTQLILNSQFHLAPLAVFLDSNERRTCIALIDRERARFFDFFLGHAEERTAVLDQIPRRVRSDGYAGYEAGRRERHVENEAMHHFKSVLEQLKAQAVAGAFDLLLIGCHNENWPEIEKRLPTELRQRLAGHFVTDPALASAEEVVLAAERMLEERRRAEQGSMIREVIGEASRNGRGSLGLKRVLDSLERGEVHRLLLGEHFAATVAECTNCEHLDTRMVRSCAVCGQPTRELNDVADLLVARAVRDGVQLMHVREDAEFERAGNVAALLRFRADQNTARKIAG
jgi:peptide subunit release factor 1 (eRF1)